MKPMSLRRLLSEQAEPLLPRIKRALSRWVGAKPVLRYIELHLTDHCNLNCAGCGHFASVAEKWYADPAEHASDMRQLAKLFSTISTIRLMGGEPLLHPQVTAFIAPTRECFPHSDIHLVTNGLLLSQAPDSLWEACRDHDITLNLTVYPPHRAHAPEWLEMARQRGVRVQHHEVEWFHAHKNLRGDSSPAEAFRLCRARYNCPFLQQGKVYLCSMPALVHHFNKRYGTEIPSSGYMDIYQPGITGHDVLDVLARPASTCGFCAYDFQPFHWTHSKPKKEDWDAATYRGVPQEGSHPEAV
jgi:hypothetical protein